MPSLGSQDSVEDAVDSLHRGTFPFLLFTGTHTDYTRIDSSLSNAARVMVLDWVRTGEFEKMLVEHFAQNPAKD